jgi:hypothetical protein
MMLRSLDHLDKALIDRLFQPLVDWIVENFSLDCFGLAKICTRLSAIAWILSRANEVTLVFRGAPAGLQVFEATVLLIGLGAIMVLHTLFQRVGEAGQGHGQANPLRMAMFGHRVTILAGLAASLLKMIMGTGSGALLAMSLLVTAAVYAGACSNRPPRRHVEFAGQWGRRQAEASGRL